MPFSAPSHTVWQGELRHHFGYNSCHFFVPSHTVCYGKMLYISVHMFENTRKWILNVGCDNTNLCTHYRQTILPCMRTLSSRHEWCSVDEWPPLFLSRMWSVLQVPAQLEGAQTQSFHGRVIQVQLACCFEEANGSACWCKQRQLQHPGVGLAGAVPGCSPVEEAKTVGSVLQRRPNCKVLEAAGYPWLRTQSRRFLPTGDDSTTRCRRHKPTLLQETTGGFVSTEAWKTFHLAATHQCAFHEVVPPPTADSQTGVSESPG